jgi:hypothetical protein
MPWGSILAKVLNNGTVTSGRDAEGIGKLAHLKDLDRNGIEL